MTVDLAAETAASSVDVQMEQVTRVSIEDLTPAHGCFLVVIAVMCRSNPGLLFSRMCESTGCVRVQASSSFYTALLHQASATEI